jgi:Holliday junction resolvasome RuvABC endonuclease subunit
MNITEDMKDNAPQIDMGDSYRLFLDMSSSCTGYVCAKMEGRKCTISRMGVMWFGADWENGQKYHHIHQSIGEFYSINAITDVIYESYHVNPNQMGNSLVVPEMIGAMKAATYDVWGMPIGTEDLSPTAWRGILKIKPIKTPKLNKEGSPKLTRTGRKMFDRDYKTPTKEYINELLPVEIPDKLISNITGNARTTPSDLYDALAICAAWHKKFGVDKFEVKEDALDGRP